jgi:diguanylate cyclase (GGDEF)-like protein
VITRAAKPRTPDLHDLIMGTGTARTLRLSIGFGTLNFAVIALWVALDTAVGPTEQPARIAIGVAAGAAAIAAVMWASTDRMLKTLPCTVFGVLSQIGTSLVIVSLPNARDGLVGCALLAVLGAQFTLLMGTRWLILHLTVAVVVIGTTVVRSAQQGQTSPSTSVLAAYVLVVSTVLTPWAARIAWSRLLVYAARSLVDPLTGLLNRAGLEHALLRLTDPTTNRLQVRCAVAVLDIDNFKAVNDTHGHQVGDAVISEVAAMLADFATARKANVARTGGEEFAVLLPLAAQEHLADIGTLLPVSTLGQLGPRATLSAGVVRLPIPPDGQIPSLASALTAADQLMYIAKRGGGATAVTEDARPPHRGPGSNPLDSFP